MNTQADALKWVKPVEWMRLEDLRQEFGRLLSNALIPHVLTTWRAEVPTFEHRRMQGLVSKAVRDALRALSPYHNSLPGLLWPDTSWVEPAEAPEEPDLPKHQLQAYRLTAAVIAQKVRNELEDLHAEYTSDANLRGLNIGLRNLTYQTMLSHLLAAWEFSYWLRVLLERDHAGAIQMPPTLMRLVGN